MLTLVHGEKLVPFAVTIEYQDDVGNSFKEVFSVDLDQFASLHSRRQSIHGQLVQLSSTLAKLVESVGKRR